MFRTLALVLMLSASVAAQDPSKQAVAAVKAATKAAVKDLREQLVAVYDNFQTDLAAAEQNYEDEQSDWQELAQSAISNLVVLQIELSFAEPAAVQELFEGPVEAAIDGLGFATGEVPLDLVLGTGGALDDARDALRAVVDKQLATALKRLKKTAKLLSKQDDVVLLVRTRRADVPDHFIVGPGLDTFQQPGGGIVIHTLGSASRRGLAQDGLLMVAGWGTEGSVTVDAGFEGDGVQQLCEINEITHVWAAIFEELPEINWAISARLGDNTVNELESFGIP